jgi:Carboxypeptidase regulatory-like domain
MRLTVKRALLATCSFLFLLNVAWADVGGKITGVVKDQTDAVVPGATVVAVNTATGVKQTTKTDLQGSYSFPLLPVGKYEIDVTPDGFTSNRTKDLAIDINSALTIDVTLQLAEQRETVTVTENAVQVETSDTQLGQVLESKQVTSLPLNGRSYTDLFATQVGVTPLTTSGSGNSTSGGGFGTVPVAGNGDTGQFSINGQRESANGFTLNGVSVQETIGQQAGIVPNLDSIAEFRILTSNADAEYGDYSGGLISVVTKSGGNQLHGDLFEFLRNTDLDARGFFDPIRAAFQQNQFGGTDGGPIKKEKVFFFADYQGQRTVQGVETGVVSVPSGSLKRLRHGNRQISFDSPRIADGWSVRLPDCLRAKSLAGHLDADHLPRWQLDQPRWNDGPGHTRNGRVSRPGR